MRFDRKLAALESRKRFVESMIRDYNRERAALAAWMEAITLAYSERTGHEPPQGDEVFWNEEDEQRADQIVLAYYPSSGA